MKCGKLALRRGDRRTAVQHMLAALDSPGSAELRFMQIDMTLARSLVDWGEREAVAKFWTDVRRLIGKARNTNSGLRTFAKASTRTSSRIAPDAGRTPAKRRGRRFDMLASFPKRRQHP